MLAAAEFRVTFGDELSRAWSLDPATLALSRSLSSGDLSRLEGFLLRVGERWSG
jgi:hypothetical protein